MKKIIFGIFAHPDDEAFGPSGALLLEARSGTDLHLVTLTRGEAGTNTDNLPDLGKVRLKEWKKAGSLIGVHTQYCFDYGDGTLNNLAMIEIAGRLRQLVSEVLQSASHDTVVEFMTIDLNGITGHIDHIVAARAASLVFFTMKKQDDRFARIRYACLPLKNIPGENISWIFAEKGHNDDEINEIIDARSARTDILDIMNAHYTQRSDCEKAIKNQGDDLGLNYFITKS